MRLEILIGMVGSGKSTYARKRADEGAIVVCHDDLTQMLHARYRYEPELRQFYRGIEEWIGHSALSSGRDAVIDRTHLTFESRRRWIVFARMLADPIVCDPVVLPPLSITVIAVTFPIETPEVHARRRVEHDSRGRSYEDWLAVARHHYGQWQTEPLSEDEGFDEIQQYRRSMD